MCGRVYLKASPAELIAKFSFAAEVAAEVLGKLPAKYNGAPSQEFPLIVKELDMPGARFTRRFGTGGKIHICSSVAAWFDFAHLLTGL